MPIDKKILIVDDDPDILEALKLSFDLADYQTKTTTKGEDAYRLVKEFNPDVIILDIFLSGINGKTICMNLKKSDGTKNIPVIMISANPDAGQSTLDVGADYFFAKPFDINELVKKTDNLLQGS